MWFVKSLACMVLPKFGKESQSSCDLSSHRSVKMLLSNKYLDYYDAETKRTCTTNF